MNRQLPSSTRTSQRSLIRKPINQSPWINSSGLTACMRKIG
ncbi:hypothetical protein [Paenibacillus sp. FSL K6-2859]